MKYFLLQDDKVLVSVDSKDGQEVIEVDNVLGMVGYRPDTAITEELQVFTHKIHLIHIIYFPLGSLLLRHRGTDEACSCSYGRGGWRGGIIPLAEK